MISKYLSLGAKELKNFVSGKMFTSHNFGLSDLLLYASLIDEGVIIQTDGSFLAAFKFYGVDMETSTDEELAILSAQLNRAFNLLTSGWMLHIDTIRYAAKDYTKPEECFFTNASACLLDHERRRIYQSEARHYENYYALSVTFRPKIDLGNKLGSFFRHSSAKPYTNYTHYLSLFKQKLNEISEILATQLNLTMMNSQQLLSYISWCLTGEQVELKLPLKYGVFLKHYLASKDLLGGDRPRVGDNYICAISISGFPNESYPAILDRLNYIDFAYRWNTRFILLNQYEADKIIDRISALWYQKRLGAADTIKLSLSIDSHININQNSDNQYKDAQSARCLNDSADVKFGFYTSAFIIMDRDKLSLTHKVGQIRGILRSLGFQNQVETYHALEAYLGTLPGYSYANVRKWLIHSLNVADIMPSTSIWSGLNNHPCSFYPKDSPPLFYAKTTGSTPLRISLHNGDNGHTLILGPTGSGKSTLLNFLIAQHMRYANARIFMFDKNRSSLPLCYSCGGSFFDLGSDNNDNDGIYFQPLANLETDLDFDFAAGFIEELCILNGMEGKFNDNHRLAVYKALKLMQQETPHNRRNLSYLRHLIHDYDQVVSQVLDSFCSEERTVFNNTLLRSGFINKLFDATEDVFNQQRSRFSVFEMGNLMECGDRVVIPVLRYLIHIISKQLNTAEPTLIVFDESFIFFKHPIFRERIIEWVKTVRKFNAAVIFATQDMSDLFNYPDLLNILKANCVTKIFLANRRASSDGIYQHYAAMGLNDKQINLIAGALKGEYFYFSDLGKRKFNLELSTDQAGFAFVAKTSQQDIKAAMDLFIKHKEQFAYHWLKYCAIDESLQQEWLKLNASLKLDDNVSV